MRELFVGLMSGTSADGIDAALVTFENNKATLIGALNQPFSRALQTGIHNLADSATCSLEQLGALDAQLGLAFADCALALLKQHEIPAHQVSAIGSHGQTVRHRPPSIDTNGFTLQIGDANLIAEKTGITTVADFRRRDMAAGGQGAPLAPAFHHWALQSERCNRVVVNIGGMSNLTWLPSTGSPNGYDLGPGNVLMDSWIQEHQAKPFDTDGSWAASGTLHLGLLTELLQHPFLSQAAPKSTGREAFNLTWLKRKLDTLPSVSQADVQATLCEFTARVISDACMALPGQELYICGGGSKNDTLMHAIKRQLPSWQVETSNTAGIDAQWMEAMAFAWLARETLARRPGNLCSVTGAKRPAILGAVYY
ncbi:anhydro-N-acetylmuramic acid kinase [Simiduia curdlanivorans]|uniref:Anhydro-N-acetylmuramic acid kinase n=1 Tax=Simiduia curdlanivorans TaxID=1492769 RepID=A0ABV8V504_9GAMM|nr:anhydro-N-acetylmuramic acid kinase [Simiduia curdlanivorans]MDN3638387.1 anhydro-N-acetylmuramic acid kinase [Simiduia curdlanivorans]